MNCFIVHAYEPASTCKCERGLQGGFPPPPPNKKATLAVVFLFGDGDEATNPRDAG
jgi:hypothetical protein